MQIFFVFILLSELVIKDFRSCLSILEHNFVTHNEIFQGIEALVSFTQNLQTHLCSSFSAYKLHHIIQAHINHAFKSLLSLCNCNDPVLRFEFTVPECSASRDDRVYYRVAILPSQHRSNAFKREFDGDIKIL